MKAFCILFLLFQINATFSQMVINVSDFARPLQEEWHSKKKNPETVYTIKKDSTRSNFLCARSEQDDNFLIKKITVDLVEFPYLHWSWRAHTLPKNGDESIKKKCDVTACVNVVLKASKWRPRTIKYSWSSTLAEGTITKSPFAMWPSRCDIVVVQSGEEKLGQWVEEKVNVLEDYKQFYNKENPKSVIIEAFVIMTDSDNTGTPSAADYDNIYFSQD